MLSSHVSGTGFRLTLNRFLRGLTENSEEGLPELTFRSCEDTASGKDGSHRSSGDTQLVRPVLLLSSGTAPQ